MLVNDLNNVIQVLGGEKNDLIDSDAIASHCKGVAKSYPLCTPGGTQNIRIIDEPDLYQMIFGSKKPEAVSHVPDRWKGIRSVLTPGGNQTSDDHRKLYDV
jgi:hypothetical protein